MTALSVLCDEIYGCQACELAQTRTTAVPGEGDAHATVMLIGEAPGFYEDQQGRPFVGSAGKFLDELLHSVGLDRSTVYIANVIKCRPPNNRDPLPGEIESCRKWLDRQIEIISPRIIVTLGRHSMAKFFKGASISKVHGTVREVDGRLCLAMYHPAAALHQQSLRKTIETDMRKLPELIARCEREIPTEQPAVIPPPEQLSLF